jgi:hypothetical protein
MYAFATLSHKKNKPFLVLLLTFILIGEVLSQDTGSPVQLRFIKGDQTHSPDSTIFDIVEIHNFSQERVEGTVSLVLPTNWSAISYRAETIALKPNEFYYYPIRISMPEDLIGGFSYVISAQFEIDDQVTEEIASITVPRKSDWRIEVDEQQIYFNAISEKEELRFELRNKGNAEEIIKVDYRVGKLIEISDLKEGETHKYYRVPANTDTTIIHEVSFKEKLSSSEKERYNNNFKETMVDLQAKNSLKTMRRSFWVTKLKSEYDGFGDYHRYVSPLNLETNVYNLMSNIAPRQNLRAYGRVLMPNNQSLDYHVAAIALRFDSTISDLRFNQNLFYRVFYKSENTRVMLNSMLGGNNLMNSFGAGLMVNQKAGARTQVDMIATSDPFRPVNSVSALVNYNVVRNVIARLGVGYYWDNENNHTAPSIQGGSRFTINKIHLFDLDLALSFNEFRQSEILNEPRNALGYSWKARYNVSTPTFSVTAFSMNRAQNYFRNSNNYLNNINARYIINETNRLNFIFTSNYFIVDRFPFRFIKPETWTRNTFGQFLYIRNITDRIALNIGPEYNSNYRDIFLLEDFYNRSLDYKFYGAFIAPSYRMDDFSSISAPIRVGLAQTILEDTLRDFRIATNLQPALNAGVSYTRLNFRLLAFYQRGPRNIADQALISSGVIPTQESYQVRPYFEKSVLNKKVRLSGFINYMFLQPSGRELMTWNLTADFFLPKGWEVSVSNNSFNNKFISEAQNLVTNRNFNMFMRAKKSFNLQQPRMKHYDLQLVYFNDLNGNGIRELDEPPVPNVFLEITRDLGDSTAKSRDNSFVGQNMVSDIDGIIDFKNIPAGMFKLDHNLLYKDMDLFLADGQTQTILLADDLLREIPLVESYKIKGKLLLIRDANSALGKVDLADIRVTATSEDGLSYFALTDAYGNFSINIPPGKAYNVTVNNVLGDQFEIKRKSRRVEMVNVKTVSIDFTFEEKERGMNIKGEQLFDFDLNGE